MKMRDALFIAAASALLIAICINAACRTMEKPGIPAEGAKDDSKLTPPKKQQKLLSSHAAFPQMSSSTSSDKTKKVDATVKRNQLLIDYEKRINALTQIPVDVKNKQISEEHAKEFDRFIEMAECGEIIPLPNETMCAELSFLQTQSKDLTNENPRRKDFFKKAAYLQSEMQRLSPIVGHSFDEITKAVDACHTSKIAMSECMRRCDFQLGLEWERAHNALEKIGVKDCIDELEEKRKASKALESSRKAITRETSSAISAASSPSTIAATNDPTVDNESKESMVAETLDLEGNSINLNDELDRGVESKRSSDMVHRKAGKKDRKAAMKPMVGRKVTQAEFARIIREPWSNTRVNKLTGEKRKISGPNKEGHGLGEANDRLFCHLCNVPVIKASQHLVTDKHQSACDSRKRRRHNKNDINPSVHSDTAVLAAREDSTNRQENDSRGKTLSSECMVHRSFALKKVFESDIAMGQLHIFKDALNAKGDTYPDVGNASHLVSDHISIIKQEEKEKMRKLIEDCYDEYSVTFDGSPIGDDAEAIALRLVHRKTKKAIDVIISIKLYGKKLTGLQIANNVIAELKECGINQFAGWRCAGVDRAGANGVAVKALEEKNIADPTFGPCHSHTNNLPGKEFSDSCKLMSLFRKYWNKSVCTRGNICKEIKTIIGKHPNIAGGVRWHNYWEQVHEMNKIGVERITYDIMPIAIRKKWSEKSAKKLVDLATPTNMPKILVEFAAASQFGKLFCECTYQLEGDDPLGASCWMVFERLDEYANRDISLSEETTKVCDRAGELMNAERSRIRVDNVDSINHSRCNILARERNIKESQSRLEDVAQQQGARRGQGVRINHAALNSGRDDGIIPQDAVSKTDLEDKL